MATLQRSPEERRVVLARQLVGVLEPLLEGGESYADLSVEAIIKAGGISRATFYAYFADKGDLLSAMGADVIEELLGTGASWWAFGDGDGRAELRDALSPAIESYRTHRAILGAVADGAAYDPRVREQLQRLIGEVAESLAAHIREAQAHGSADPSLDPERTANWLIWMHERGLQQLVSGVDEDEAAALLDALTDIVWRTLYAGHR